MDLSCLNFWDKACWFLSLRFFRLLSSSLLLFPQHFGRYVLRPSSDVCRTREPSRNHGGRLFWFRLANGIRTGDARGFNNRLSSKFCEGSRVRQTSEEGRRTYRPKRCGNNNKDEDNSPKNLNDKNQMDLFELLFKMIINYINTMTLKILMLQYLMKYLLFLRWLWRYMFVLYVIGDHNC